MQEKPGLSASLDKTPGHSTGLHGAQEYSDARMLARLDDARVPPGLVSTQTPRSSRARKEARVGRARKLAKIEIA